VAFLDSLKRNKRTYAVLLALGMTILVINNFFQFLDFIVRDWKILLLSFIVFTLLIVYLAMNREALR